MIAKRKPMHTMSPDNAIQPDCAGIEQGFIYFTPNMVKELKNAGVLVYFLHFCHSIATGTFPMRH